MQRCWECRKSLFSSEKIFSDPRIKGFFCSKCLQRAIEKHTIACQWCDCQFICYQIYTNADNLCPECHIKDTRRERRIVKSNLKRAEEAGTPATLTLAEWTTTLRHFNGMCAYCSIRAYEVLEHFTPVHIAGTTQKNCIPACNSCNAHKNSKSPNDVKHITQKAIDRIQDYFKSL